MAWWVWLTVVMAVAYLGLCLALYLGQRSLLYYPQPAAIDDDRCTLRLQVPDAELQITHRALDGARALIYFGGNAEDVSITLEPLCKAFPEHAIYLMHYRGWGRSTGRPTEAALRQDALDLFDLVQSTHPEVALLGRSLGSGVAIQVAARRRVARLVLVTPFASIAEMAAYEFPYIPVRWLMRDPYESWKAAPSVLAPTPVIAAEHDKVVPASSTQRLVRSFPKGTVRLTVLHATSHHNIANHPKYLRTLIAALA